MATDCRAAFPAVIHRIDRRQCSIFDLPPDFFDSSRLIPSGTQKPSLHDSVNSLRISIAASRIREDEEEVADVDEGFEALGNADKLAVSSRLSCNTCKAEYDSLQDQRSHFKSDFHRLNVKLSLAGKNTVKEDDFDEFTSNSFPIDFDVSSISGSEDEDERISQTNKSVNEGSIQNLKQKLFFSLQSGDKVSLWKCFILKDSETILYDDEDTSFLKKEVQGSHLRENNVIQKLQHLVCEPKENRLRIVLLAHGGHFAACVFDGSKVVAHKTFHRYVVRAKAGKKQSAKDGGGRTIHSAGASLRRYNELALKKDIQELLASWKSYFDASYCVFVHAPSDNRQLLFRDEKTLFGNNPCDVRNIPSTVRRPTLKEAQRIYSQLSQVAYEVEEREIPEEENLTLKTADIIDGSPGYKNVLDTVTNRRPAESSLNNKVPDEQTVCSESETEIICKSTPLHEAAKTGDAIQVLDLLEKGLDPTAIEERGKTPYMLATDKEVRNTFRRFMAANLDKWDWDAAKVPSALTKEMEESQAAKQAEKEAKRKAKAKELKKLRKAREKQAQAEAAAAAQCKKNTVTLLPAPGAQPQLVAMPPVSKEEALSRKLAEDRETRAAAAERRITAASSSSSQESSSITLAPTSHTAPRSADDMACSCCKASLLGKVPFHRYNYKYCSSTCMHVHKEFLEEG